jgi:6-phosphogluconolactonase
MNRRECVGPGIVASLIVIVMMISFSAAAAEPAEGGSAFVYVGTYTSGKSEGIYVMEMNLATGELGEPALAAKANSPSFLAIHPNRRFLYAVTESSNFQGKPTGAVGAFAIDEKSGKLTLLNQQPSAGAGPCHLIVDPAGKNVLVANYGGGSVACLPIDEEGRLEPPSATIQHTGSSVNPSRQKEPHAHSINLDPAGRFAFAADLGVDKVFIYKFDPAKGSLTPNDPPSASVEPGSGPRHFAFHPSGKYAYVINEITLTVTAFAYDAERGALTPIETVSTLPPDAKGQGFSTAEVVAHPSGKFLYGSNRGHDTIAAFAIDQSSGKLTRIENEPTQGKTPRNFAIDPTGRWLLAENQGSDTIVVFRINQETGELDATGVKVDAPSPVCVRFLRK